MNAETTRLIRPAPGTQSRRAFFIGGRWVESARQARIAVIDSATEDVLGEVASAEASDVDAAVESARAALPAWAATAPQDRARYLLAIRDELAARADQITALISAEVGTPLRISRAIQVGLPLVVLGQYAELLDDYAFEEPIGNSLVVKGPMGVVAAITPWNYPLHQMVAKVAAALSAGCTVVMKPSGVAPLSTFELADAAERAGLPPGVLNLITGPGAVLGKVIAGHKAVDMISFTGSTAAGTSIYQLAAAGIKRVALELGGKSANVILEDADLARAVSSGVNNAFLNSGQTCTALTRMLVPRRLIPDAIELAVAACERLRLGDPFDEGTRLGPLVSRAQVETVRGYVESGIQQGATLVVGGPDPPKEFEKGFYFRPTILADVLPDMVVAREEIFGPVLCILAYETESEALKIANASEYGLAGAVWSGDLERATGFARRMATGQVDINGAKFNPAAPFGGFKKSGVGRELGRFGLEQFLEPKALQF